MEYFKPINPGTIPYTKQGKIIDILYQIEHANCEAVEIDWKALGHKTPADSVSIFSNVIKRKGLPLKGIMRNHRIFIVKTKGE